MACNCGVCVAQRTLFDVVKNGTADERKHAVGIVLSELYELEMDRDWNNSVEDGTWPNAVDILKRRIAKYTEVIKGIEDGDALPKPPKPADLTSQA